jgi:hypothetical protein
LRLRNADSTPSSSLWRCHQSDQCPARQPTTSLSET